MNSPKKSKQQTTIDNLSKLNGDANKSIAQATEAQNLFEIELKKELENVRTALLKVIERAEQEDPKGNRLDYRQLNLLTDDGKNFVKEANETQLISLLEDTRGSLFTDSVNGSNNISKFNIFREAFTGKKVYDLPDEPRSPLANRLSKKIRENRVHPEEFKQNQERIIKIRELVIEELTNKNKALTNLPEFQKLVEILSKNPTNFEEADRQINSIMKLINDGALSNPEKLIEKITGHQFKIKQGGPYHYQNTVVLTDSADEKTQLRNQLKINLYKILSEENLDEKERSENAKRNGQIPEAAREWLIDIIQKQAKPGESLRYETWDNNGKKITIDLLANPDASVEYITTASDEQLFDLFANIKPTELNERGEEKRRLFLATPKLRDVFFPEPSEENQVWVSFQNISAGWRERLTSTATKEEASHKISQIQEMMKENPDFLKIPEGLKITATLANGQLNAVQKLERVKGIYKQLIEPQQPRSLWNRFCRYVLLKTAPNENTLKTSLTGELDAVIHNKNEGPAEKRKQDPRLLHKDLIASEEKRVAEKMSPHLTHLEDDLRTARGLLADYVNTVNAKNDRDYDASKNGGQERYTYTKFFLRQPEDTQEYAPGIGAFSRVMPTRESIMKMSDGELRDYLSNLRCVQETRAFGVDLVAQVVPGTEIKVSLEYPDPVKERAAHFSQALHGQEKKPAEKHVIGYLNEGQRFKKTLESPHEAPLEEKHTERTERQRRPSM